MARKVLITIIVLLVAVAGARVLFAPAVVPTLAVSPTLNQGDNILINRLDSFMGKPLERFELVAIVPPFVDGSAFEPAGSPLSTIADLTGLPIAPTNPIDLRRVIALPGETVVVRKDLGIFIDGKLLDESSYTKDEPETDIFVLSDINRHSSDQGVVQSNEDSQAPIVVPPGMVFVLADNRKFPGSETWGFVNQDRVQGKVVCKLDKNGVQQLKTPALAFATEKIAINDEGVRALDKGEFTKAIHLFKSALAIDNNFELARDNLSIAYNNFAIQNAGKPDVALDSLHKALFLDPDNELTKKNLSGILKRMGRDATKYEDRAALAQDALKRGKTISALVEYRAAIKLNPNPTILGEISNLEAKCNFPAHAIPEDLVDSKSKTTPLTADAPRTELGENKVALTSALSKLNKSLEPNPTVKQEDGKVEAKPASDKRVSNMEKTDRKKEKEASSVSTEKDTSDKKAEVAKPVSDKKKVKEKPIEEKSGSPEQTPVASASDTKVDLPSAKTAPKPDAERITPKPEPTALQSRKLKKPENKFNIGAIMENIVAAISPKKSQTTDGSESYRGPPLLKKP